MYHYSITYNVTPVQIEQISSKLKAYNISQIGEYQAEKILILVHDNGHFVGGCLGIFQFEWLIIDILWIEPNYRKQGIGQALIERAEQQARNKDIRRARLNTASFQNALGFYQNLGYEVFAQLPITTKPDSEGRTEHWDYFMKKDL